MKVEATVLANTADYKHVFTNKYCMLSMFTALHNAGPAEALQ